MKSNTLKREQKERQLKALFQKYKVKHARYDHDCMDMCVPYAEGITNAEYRDFISDKDKVN